MMRFNALSAACVLVGLCAGAVGATKDDLLAAAKKLGDSPNYSWQTSVRHPTNQGVEYGGGEGMLGGGPIAGMTEKNGYTVFSVAWPDQNYHVVFNGHTTVIKTGEGWQAVFEISPPTGDSANSYRPEEFILNNTDLRTPDKIAEDLLNGTDNFAAVDDGYRAKLSAATVAKLLAINSVRRDLAGPTVINNPVGTASFWTKDGAISKFEYNATGTMILDGSHYIDRVVTTEISDVGVTKVVVPEEAKARLAVP